MTKLDIVMVNYYVSLEMLPEGELMTTYSANDSLIIFMIGHLWNLKGGLCCVFWIALCAFKKVRSIEIQPKSPL